MSTENITSQILEEAQSVRQDNLAQALEKCSSIKANAEAMVENIIQSAVKKGSEERDKAVIRRKSVAYIDSRKVILEKKQQIIGECFAMATDKIINMDENQYINLLVSMGIKSDVKCGTLLFNEKEKQSIGQKVVDRLNELLNCSGAFKLSDETGSMKGGYILNENSSFVDNTIESLIDEVKPSMLSDISGMLFTETTDKE